MRYNKVLCIIFYGANYYNKYNNYRNLERFVVLFRRSCQLSAAIEIPRSPTSTALRGISIAALPLPTTFNYHNKLVILDAMIHTWTIGYIRLHRKIQYLSRTAFQS